MGCGQRGEMRDDGEGEGGRREGRREEDGGEKMGEWREDGGRMEGRWKMTEEVTDCNSYEALRLQFSCDNVNMGNGTGWGGKRYCMGSLYNTDDGLRSIAYGLFFSMKKSTAQERRHTPIDSVILYSRQKYRTFIYMPRRAYSLLNTTISMSLAYLPGSNNQKLLMPSVNLSFLILRFCRTVMNKRISP